MTPATTTLPVIGGAIRLPEIPKYLQWLVSKQRDLEIQDPCYPDYLDQDWTAEVREGAQRLKDGGFTGRIGIHGAFDGLELFTYDKKIREVIRTRFLQSLEFGAVLNASTMVIHSPFIAFGHGLVNYSPASHRQYIIDAAHAILEDVLPVAAQMNCTLVIECILDKNPLPLLELVRSFNSEHVRLSIDTGHAFIMQQDGGTAPHQWVIEAGELLGHVHLQDVDGLADRHWQLGRGNINWAAFFYALGQLKHKPVLVLEVLEIAGSMQWLERNELGM